MNGRTQSAVTLPGQSVGPSDEHLLAMGKLQFLASFCPLHSKFPSAALGRLFYPAINHDCVRFFDNEDGKTCAALIWARLSDDVSERMIYDRAPPQPDEWASGHNLWFLDLLAPFGHAGQVARHIARKPPEGPFFFARINAKGEVRKVVQGDASQRQGRRMQAFRLKEG